VTTTARTAALAIAALDCIAWLVVAFMTFASSSDQATKGLDNLAGWAITLLLLVTAVPALVLTYRRRAPRIALTLALAFPGVFVVLFIAAVIAFLRSAPCTAPPPSMVSGT
jgi:hypothetical protein